MMENNSKEKLKDQIWKTRVSRINAEKRLQQKQSFIQAINIYYSCITIIYSIMLTRHIFHVLQSHILFDIL